MDRLVVVNDAGIARGGATTLAIASAIAARRRGVRVTYVTAAGDISPELHEAGCDILQIKGDRLSSEARWKGLVHGLYRTATKDTLGGWIAENDTPGTVYHLHNWSHFLSPSVFDALKPVDHRLVITAHDFFLGCPNGAQFSFTEEAACWRKSNSLACLTHACDRRSYADKIWRSTRHFIRQNRYDLSRRKPSVLLIHDSMAPALALGGVPPECMSVVRNPITPFSAVPVDVRANKEVLFVGRLTYEKGADLAGEAAARAGLPIRFAGIGPLEDKLGALPQAQLEGWCNREKIAQLIQKARMLVMPSRWIEPYGMVAVEALWSGVPVIVSDSAYLAPEIAAAGAGLAVDTRTLETFAEAMRWIADDDDLAEDMSHKALTQTMHLGLTPDGWGDALFAHYTDRLKQPVADLELR